jgi:hypothetical protein
MGTSGDLKSPWLYCRQNFGRGMDFEAESAPAGWPGRKQHIGWLKSRLLLTSAMFCGLLFKSD